LFTICVLVFRVLPKVEMVFTLSAHAVTKMVLIAAIVYCIDYFTAASILFYFKMFERPDGLIKTDHGAFKTKHLQTVHIYILVYKFAY